MKMGEIMWDLRWFKKNFDMKEYDDDVILLYSEV